MKKVGVIIVNYREYAEKFLAECRDSLRTQSFPREQTIIYIIDNATTAETQKYLKTNFPEAKIIPREDGNYSAANKAGLQAAIQDGCELFVQVNMDVKMNVHWLRELVIAVESDEKIGLAQSKILLYPRNEAETKDPLINTLGNKMHFLGFGYTDGYGEKNSAHLDRELKEIQGYASGCSVIIKKALLDKIGLPDEEYYMYHDDIELSWRAKLAGYRIVLAPKSIIYHKYEFKRSVLMVYYMERNRYLAIFSFYRLPTISLIFPALIIMDCGMLLFSLINGWFPSKCKAYLYFLKSSTWKHIVDVRRTIKKNRRRKDSTIVKSFSGKILFQEIKNPLLKYIANPIFDCYWRAAKKILFW
jgi:hypothetical protein